MNIATIARPRAAAQAWQRAYQAPYARARAETLVAVVSAIPEATVGDLLVHVSFDDSETYDVCDPGRVDVPLGDLVGRPGDGPSVSDFVRAIEVLDVVGVVLKRPLAEIVDGWAR